MALGFVGLDQNEFAREEDKMQVVNLGDLIHLKQLLWARCLRMSDSRQSSV